MSFLSNTIRENRFVPEEIPQFEDKLFFEGTRQRSYLERFGVLMFLATVIATMGVIAGSSATVIGAMIIAPMMTPIIASVAALLQGRTDRAFRSTLIVLWGPWCDRTFLAAWHCSSLLRPNCLFRYQLTNNRANITSAC